MDPHTNVYYICAKREKLLPIIRVNNELGLCSQCSSLSKQAFCSYDEIFCYLIEISVNILLFSILSGLPWLSIENKIRKKAFLPDTNTNSSMH